MSSLVNQNDPSAEPPPAATSAQLPVAKRYLWLAMLIGGYIGIYLCRRNFSVAIPLLQEHFGVSRAEVGLIASYSTLAYAVGKFVFGVVVDRVGGRIGFLGSILAVSVMGLAGGLAPTLALLTFFYSANRFAGAAGWPAMVKLTPDWFELKQLPFALALLSLSFVAGGAIGAVFAGLVAEWSGNNWRAVMAVPSFVLLGFFALSWWILPRPKEHEGAASGKKNDFQWNDLLQLFRIPQFWVTCALSFTLTLLRETFNTWTVDFIKTEGGADVSNRIAAFLSTPFDILGAIGILAVGWIYGRINVQTRRWFLFTTLAVLGLTLFSLPNLFSVGLGMVTAAIGLVGFLTYGPYSLLGGTLSVEVQGQRSAGTVSGMVDGVGYIAGILAGAQFGWIVDVAGYRTGFRALSGLAFVSAILCLFLYRQGRAPKLN